MHSVCRRAPDVGGPPEEPMELVCLPRVHIFAELIGAILKLQAQQKQRQDAQLLPKPVRL